MRNASRGSRAAALVLALFGGLLLAAGAASPGLAQSPPAPGGLAAEGMHMGRENGDLWLMIRASGLTPDQQAKVRAILSAHRATTRPLIEQLRQAQQELSARLLAPGALQPADLQPQLTRIGQLRDQLAQGSAQAAIDVRAVLTPEQLGRVGQTRDRLKQLRDEMRQIMEPARP